MNLKSSQERMLSGESKPFECRPESASVEELEKGDAVKALSFAAFQLRRQLDKKTEEARSLRAALANLEEAWKATDKEKEELEVDLRVYRRSVEAHSNHIERLCRQLELKDSEISKLAEEKLDERQNVEDLKGKLAAAHKDFEWVREESISKGEQIEYFEYELLSKNDEIDNLRQDLDKKLRKIVEMEVDLDIVDSRNTRALKKQAATESNGNGTNAAHNSAKQECEPSEAHTEKRIGIRRLLDLKCQTVEAEEELLPTDRSRCEWSPADMSIAETSPTESSLTTATSDTMSTMTPSSPRHRLSRGKSSANVLTEKYIDIIDNLRSDLAAIEERYKRDKYSSFKLVEELRQENNEYLIKLVCMESKLKQNDPNVTSYDSDLLRDLDEEDNFTFESSLESGDTPRDNKPTVPGSGAACSNSFKLPSKIHFLEQKIETLEGQNVLHERAVEDLKVKCQDIERQAKTKALGDKQIIVNLTLQNEAQSLKIGELERQLSASRHRKASKEHTDYTSKLETRLQAQLLELARLRRENDLKDHRVEALRSELVDVRTKQKLRNSYAGPLGHTRQQQSESHTESSVRSSTMSEF
jgi:chromosome segregation ATPase